ncbi:MAG TPA: hypothetical protein VIA45_03260 [Thermoanaerobaculia bacterium]
MRRLAAAAALVLAAGAIVQAGRRAVEDRRSLMTGDARWIWLTRDIEEPRPTSFRAASDFAVSGEPPRTAPCRIFVSGSWALDVNGRRAGAGAQRPGDALATLDVGSLLRPGDNRVSIEASSPDGAGGILFWLDLGGGRTIVSSRAWRVTPISPEPGPERAAVEWGRPPMYPWRYPPLPAPTPGRP